MRQAPEEGDVIPAYGQTEYLAEYSTGDFALDGLDSSSGGGEEEQEEPGTVRIPCLPYFPRHITESVFRNVYGI